MATVNPLNNKDNELVGHDEQIDLPNGDKACIDGTNTYLLRNNKKYQIRKPKNNNCFDKQRPKSSSKNKGEN